MNERKEEEVKIRANIIFVLCFITVVMGGRKRGRRDREREKQGVRERDRERLRDKERERDRG